MDIASIHHHEEVRSIIEESNCILVYSAPYGAEANPIKRVFGLWMLRSESELTACTSFYELINVISKYFYILGNREISNTITGVQTKIWQIIYEKLDI